MKTFQFFLLNPFSEDNLDFYREQAAWRYWRVLEERWLDAFQSGKDREVVFELKNSTLNLNLPTKIYLARIENEYYISSGKTSTQNKEKTKELVICPYMKVNLAKYREKAVERVSSMLNPYELSSGDKLLIRRIALDSLDTILDILSSNQIPNIPFDQILWLHKNEGTIAELERYGFEVRSAKLKTYH